MIRIDSRADAGADEPCDAVDGDRSDERLPQSMSDRRDIVHLPQLSQDDRELVSPQPGSRVVLERVRVQPPTYLLEHEVALVIAERVVHLLEPVQIEHE